MSKPKKYFFSSPDVGAGDFHKQKAAYDEKAKHHHHSNDFIHKMKAK